MARNTSVVAISVLGALVVGYGLGQTVRPAMAEPADGLPAMFQPGSLVRDRTSDAKTFTVQEVAGEWFRVDDSTWVHAPTGMRWESVKPAK